MTRTSTPARTTATRTGPQPSTLLEDLPDPMLDNFVAAYEAGKLQATPRLRFVDDRGRVCVAAAMAGASSASELVTSEAFRSFRGGALEHLSRAFEAGEVTADEVYAGCLLELAGRRAARRGSLPEPAARAPGLAPA